MIVAVGDAPGRLDVEEEPGCLVVRWEHAGDGDAEIRIGLTPEPTAHTLVMQVSAPECSARLAGMAEGRHYVSVWCEGSRSVAAVRRVRFEGTLNFRDLGGYPTDSGGRTWWGRLYRSSNLHRLTADDLAVFDGLGVRAVFDLRRDDDRTSQPGPRPARALPVSTRFGPFDPSSLRARADGERWLLGDYQAMLRDGAPVFGALLTALAAADASPAVFHCAGGKDRTGLAAALLLTWLGVDRDTVLDDYELTSRYQSFRDAPAVVDAIVGMGAARPAVEGLMGTPRWVMAQALDLVDTAYGGIESYLRGPARIGDGVLEGLRARLVSPSRSSFG